MTDINTCPCCDSDMISVRTMKICGITIECKIKCHSCKHTVVKATERGAYKTWEKERKDNDR
jgi:transposase-like protein